MSGSCLSFSYDLADIQYLIGADVEKLRQSSALFLLKLKEHHRISQVALDFVVEGSRSLLSQTLNRVREAVKAKLAEAGIDLDSVSGFEDTFEDVIDPFDSINTCYLQEKYFREKFGLIVSSI